MNQTDRSIVLFTIGFGQKTAQKFFDTLIQASVKCLIDARLNNVSQLAGFTKKQDLDYFLKTIAGIEYVHLTELAPTKEILDAYKKNGGNWEEYERQFLTVIADRKIEETLAPDLIDRGCLLCSEPKPNYCHRRLVAEYLQLKWGNVTIHHL